MTIGPDRMNNALLSDSGSINIKRMDDDTVDIWVIQARNECGSSASAVINVPAETAALIGRLLSRPDFESFTWEQTP